MINNIINIWLYGIIGIATFFSLVIIGLIQNVIFFSPLILSIYFKSFLPIIIVTIIFIPYLVGKDVKNLFQ